MEIARSYQSAAVLAAAADLDLFGGLAARSRTFEELAGDLGCDPRGMRILVDALTGLGMLVKEGDRYRVPVELSAFLDPNSPRSVLAMIQHQANCLRRWVQLAGVVRSGRPAEWRPSLRGEQGDLEAFIGAMDNVSAPMAAEVVGQVVPPGFGHLLDVGGASGTWSIAFLRACPEGKATLFDLPEVMGMARQRLAAAGLIERVALAAGDFLADQLPAGSDLAWVSAIVHQNSRAQNRALFGNVFQALVPGGRIVVRDILMDESRTAPVTGALFAVNMLVATAGGGTFVFDELREDLEAAGFAGVRVLRREEGMSSLVAASKPGG